MTAALSNEEIEDRFFLSGRMEIHSVLNELVHRREPVSVHFNAGHGFLLTTLLEVRSDVLIFDPAGSEDANRALLASPGGVMVAAPDGIRVQFSFGKVHRFRWGDSDALWVELPERVVRLQRREYYRVGTSRARPLRVGLVVGEDARSVEAALHDIGVGGIGVSTPHGSLFTPGAALPGIALNLPDFGELGSEGVVRHVTRVVDQRGKAAFRVGLRFVGLGRTKEVTIQRFIVHVEQERRRLLDG